MGDDNKIPSFSQAEPETIPFALLTSPGESRENANQELAQSLHDLDAWLQEIAPRAAFSSLFKKQLAWNLCRKDCAYSGHRRCFHVLSILNEVSFLEGSSEVTQTKPHSRLTGPLNGFWHKHFFDSQFLAANLSLELERNFDRLWYRDFVPKLQEMTGRPWQGTEMTNEYWGLLAYVMGIDAYSERSGNSAPAGKPRMTGEWIIYAFEGNRRVYLTLALHGEAQKPEMIISRLKTVAQEFPFVSTLLASSAA
jgi:hypothetical protein